jgi:hypothetical protein
MEAQLIIVYLLVLLEFQVPQVLDLLIRQNLLQVFINVIQVARFMEDLVMMVILPLRLLAQNVGQ